MASYIELDIAKHLLSIGCCERCSLRLLNNLPNELINFENIEEEFFITEPSKLSTKRPKLNPCIICLDTLRENALSVIFREEFLETMRQYENKTFAINVTVPDCIAIREFSLTKYITQTFPEYTSTYTPTFKVNRISQAYRLSIQKKLEQLLNKKYKNYSDLQAHIHFTYEDDINEITKLIQLDKPRFIQLLEKSRHKVWSKKAIMRTIQNASDETFKATYQVPPPIPNSASVFHSCNVFHLPVYIIGKIIKSEKKLPMYSDDLSLINILKQDFAKRFMTIKENIYIRTTVFALNEFRILGTGIPFVIKVLNPKRDLNCLDNMKNMENEMNIEHAKHGFLIRELLVSQKNVLKMYDNYIETVQRLCTLICSVNSAEQLPVVIRSLNSQRMPMNVEQETSKIPGLDSSNVKLLELKARKLNGSDVCFQLDMMASAGLHIEDFVALTTTPSLEQLAKTSLNIHSLDVVEYGNRWPPTPASTDLSPQTRETSSASASQIDDIPNEKAINWTNLCEFKLKRVAKQEDDHVAIEKSENKN